MAHQRSLLAQLALGGLTMVGCTSGAEPKRPVFGVLDAASSAHADGDGGPSPDSGLVVSHDGGAERPDDAGAAWRADAGNPQDDAGAAQGDDPFEALRDLCVATINDYRATLGLPPLARASESEESCSDEGAELDHTTGRAHGSAGEGVLDCRSYAVAQNSCPDWGYGGRWGTREEALTGCLRQMWQEGEPPQGIPQCVDEYFNDQPACFLAHGHYINMVSTDSTRVSCGFYDDGEVMWMNQDFR